MGKKSLIPPSGKEIKEHQRNRDLKTTEDNSSCEEGEVSLKNDKLQSNGHGTEAKSDKNADQYSQSDDSSKSRFCSLIATFLIECLYVLLLFVMKLCYSIDKIFITIELTGA